MRYVKPTREALDRGHETLLADCRAARAAGETQKADELWKLAQANRTAVEMHYPGSVPAWQRTAMGLDGYEEAIRAELERHHSPERSLE
jgi:hypothetical protein